MIRAFLTKLFECHPPVESPFSGPPLTRLFRERDGSGNLGCVVKAEAVTPARAKVASTLATWTSLVLFAAMAHALLTYERPLDVLTWAIGLGLPLALQPVFHRVYRHWLRRKTVFLFTTTQLRVRRGFTSRTYDRTLVHQIVLLPHDRMEREKIANDLAERRGAKRGRIFAKPRFYADSYHIAMNYMGRRADFMTVHQRKPADTIFSRLVAIDELMNRQLRAGKPISIAPVDEWNDQPGELPRSRPAAE